MNLNEIAHNMREAARKREENGGVKADSKSLFKHLATEVIEAEEAFFFFDNDFPAGMIRNGNGIVAGGSGGFGNGSFRGCGGGFLGLSCAASAQQEECKYI